ncbi:MAG: NAD(+)/NADH kinase [Deltaproteobacteria bacterium]|nr:NAD(+)/NADH kinase [Deltaproteobacteria bacterium]
MPRPRILVVHRRSTFTTLVSERRLASVSRLVKAGDPLVANMLLAHERHVASLARVRQELKARGVRGTFRHHLDGLDPDAFDLVVTVGGDGTVLHASHAIDDTPVLSVNSAPETSVGYFAAATAENFGEVLDLWLGGGLKPLRLHRMEVRLNGDLVTERVLNDVLLCHECPASTSRYVLCHKGDEEPQLSSGVWVATAAGSTAAIRSAGGRVMPVGSQRLEFAVREPFPSGGASELVFPRHMRGFVEVGESLVIRSKTAAACLYVDGPHEVFKVHFGDVVTFKGSKRPLWLVGRRRRRGTDFP